MEPPSYPQQALAIRRHTALLSLRTYTPLRHLVFDAIIRMSLDTGKSTAPILSQAWFARHLGIDKGDLCRAEKDLKRFGMLRIRQGADHFRLYEARFDIEHWGGDKKFRWRIADPGQRKRALEAEESVANTGGPGPAEQTTFPLEIEPTVEEEFGETLQQLHISDAVDAASAGTAAPRPHQTSSTFSDPEPARGTSEWFAWKERRGFRSGAGLPASVSAAEPASALGVRPTQGRQSTARRPLPPEARWGDPQRTDPTPGGSALGGLPTQGGSTGPSELSGARGVGETPNDALGRRPTAGAKIGEAPNASVGETPNALGRRPTAKAPAHTTRERAPASASAFSIQHLSKIHLGINASEKTAAAASAAMPDAAIGAGKDAHPGRAPDELLSMVFDVIRADTPGLVNHWRRLLASPAHQEVALGVLSDVQVRRGTARNGVGERIESEGAWFVRTFYIRAGIKPKKGKGAGQ